MRLSRKTKRAISADEAIARYFHNMKAEYERWATKRFRLAEVVQRRKDGVSIVMQILNVHHTENGIFIEVC